MEIVFYNKFTAHTWISSLDLHCGRGPVVSGIFFRYYRLAVLPPVHIRYYRPVLAANFLKHQVPSSVCLRFLCPYPYAISLVLSQVQGVPGDHASTPKLTMRSRTTSQN